MSIFETNRFTARTPEQAPQEVAYPARFHFRIITEVGGFKEPDLLAVLAAYQVTAPLTASQASSAGRYQAYSVSVEIRTHDELHAFDAAVKRVPGVKMLL